MTICHYDYQTWVSVVYVFGIQWLLYIVCVCGVCMYTILYLLINHIGNLSFSVNCCCFILNILFVACAVLKIIVFVVFFLLLFFFQKIFIYFNVMRKKSMYCSTQKLKKTEINLKFCERKKIL